MWQTPFYSCSQTVVVCFSLKYIVQVCIYTSTIHVMITLWYDIPSIRNRNIYYRISYNIYRYSPFLQVNIFIWLIGERYDAISQVHCPCLRCARPKAMTFPPNITTAFLIKHQRKTGKSLSKQCIPVIFVKCFNMCPQIV